MTYACLGGGKRFRAILVYACGEISGAELDSLDTLAAAVEMVHAYSLAHDDLPAMDDDDLRRGRATCHIEFDEAMAILAGDALQSRALEIVASDRWNPAGPAKRARMVEVLAHAIGSCGMAGGQALDMDATGNSVGFQELVVPAGVLFFHEDLKAFQQGNHIELAGFDNCVGEGTAGNGYSVRITA